MLGVLMTPQPVWEEISCPTLCQSVRLCHLQQLFMYLEERMDGGPLANVLAKYRARLSPEMDEDLRCGNDIPRGAKPSSLLYSNA